MALPSPMAVAAGGAAEAARPAFEMADVVRAFGRQYLRTYPSSPEQRQVLRAMANCRSERLGGHVQRCEHCSYQRMAYHSCRNRHCPKCQGKESATWMAAEQAMLLPVRYFHNVFTLPHGLNPLLRVNRRLLLALLFRAVARTLRTFAFDPAHLGAEPAITIVLHTWGQTQEEHYHLHCVISAGGLSLDGRRWVHAQPRTRRVGTGKRTRRRPFLFAVRALSRVFRAKFIAGLERARRNGTLQYAGASAALRDPQPWKQLTDALWAKDWVVYSKAPFGGPAHVLKYLSRYTHRIAISNRRILSVENGVVRFAYRDYADGYAAKELALAAPEFLRRFLQHVLPKGFMRIRHYGITANCGRAQKLARARELLGVVEATPAPAPLEDAGASRDAPNDPDDAPAVRCPLCGGRMRVTELLAPAPWSYDSS